MLNFATSTSFVPFEYSGAPPAPSVFAKAKAAFVRGASRTAAYVGNRLVDFATPRSVNGAVWRVVATTVVYIVAHNLIADTVSHFKAANFRASIDRELGPLLPMQPSSTKVAPVLVSAVEELPAFTVRYEPPAAWPAFADAGHTVNVSFAPYVAQQKPALLSADILPSAEQLRDVTRLLGSDNKVLVAYANAANICVHGTVKVSDAAISFCPTIMDRVGDAIEAMVDAKLAHDTKAAKAVSAGLLKDMRILSDVIEAEELRTTPPTGNVIVAGAVERNHVVASATLRADSFIVGTAAETKSKVAAKRVSAPKHAGLLLSTQGPREAANGNRPVRMAKGKTKRDATREYAPVIGSAEFWQKLTNG